MKLDLGTYATKEAIVALISAPAAFGVDLFTLLSVHRLENGQYVVLHSDGMNTIIKETTHTSPEEAADAFLKMRADLQLGFDYEVEDPPNEKA